MEASWERNDFLTRVMLGFVGEDVPEQLIALWTDDQVKQVEAYVARLHFIANDHDDLAPLPRPQFLSEAMVHG